MKGIRHHFIDSHSINEDFNAGTFASQAKQLISGLLDKDDHVIITGGSGLYLDALLFGMDDLPDQDPGTRAELNRKLDEHGIDPLLEELRKLDPVYYEKVDQKNPQRIIRALEVISSTGKPYSEHLTSKQQTGIDIPWIMFTIDIPREELYERINKRVDQMFIAGLVDEVQGLSKHRSLNSLQTVGYKEVFRYLDGDISLEEAKEQVKQHTRNYAKRQLTWLRRYDDSNRVGPDQFDEIPGMIRKWQESLPSWEAD